MPSKSPAPIRLMHLITTCRHKYVADQYGFPQSKIQVSVQTSEHKTRFQNLTIRYYISIFHSSEKSIWWTKCQWSQRRSEPQKGGRTKRACTNSSTAWIKAVDSAKRDEKQGEATWSIETNGRKNPAITGINLKIKESVLLLIDTTSSSHQGKAKEAAEKANPNSNQSSMSLCLLDIKDALTEKSVRWIPPNESTTYGRGSPEEAVLYSIVHGRGELVVFGGVQKFIATQSTTNSPGGPNIVSNAVYFIQAPKCIIWDDMYSLVTDYQLSTNLYHIQTFVAMQDVKLFN